jgi:hypothetical protein
MLGCVLICSSSSRSSFGETATSDVLQQSSGANGALYSLISPAEPIPVDDEGSLNVFSVNRLLSPELAPSIRANGIPLVPVSPALCHKAPQLLGGVGPVRSNSTAFLTDIPRIRRICGPKDRPFARASVNPVWHMAALPFSLLSATSQFRIWTRDRRCAAANP